MNIGNIISLGFIDKVPLRWTVLDISRNKALLLADKAIENRIYHEKPGKTTWERCSLRRYLNNFFFIYAFSDIARRSIVSTNLLNMPNPEYGTPGGHNTKDRLFLLSGSEYAEYFSCQKVSKLPEFWWLRSPGYRHDTALFVYADGSINQYLGTANSFRIAVRPALWLDLEVYLNHDRKIYGKELLYV